MKSVLILFTLLATFFASTLAEIKDINFKCGQASQQWKLSTTKCQSPYAESWLVDPMSELLLFVYNKNHVTLHVKSNAEKVNSPTYLRSLIKLSHNYPYSFRQVVVVTSTLASLQRKRGISNKTAGSPGRTERSLQHCWSCSYIWMWIQQEEDVSSFGVGGRFLQDDQPVAFDSNTLQVTEQFSAVTGKESLAVYLGFNLSL